MNRRVEPIRRKRLRIGDPPRDPNRPKRSVLPSEMMAMETAQCYGMNFYNRIYDPESIPERAKGQMVWKRTEELGKVGKGSKPLSSMYDGMGRCREMEDARDATERFEEK
uniref:Uncharacterized protein n=1 Tax=Caenorhabditis japonica TaxID=281687 RepID=A0A8R1IRG1_CAEJA